MRGAPLQLSTRVLSPPASRVHHGWCCAQMTVVARLDQTYRFNAMSDFQYLGKCDDSRGDGLNAQGQKLLRQLTRDTGGSGGAVGRYGLTASINLCVVMSLAEVSLLTHSGKKVPANAKDHANAGHNKEQEEEEEEEELDLAPPIFAKQSTPRDYSWRPSPNARILQRRSNKATAPAGSVGMENAVGRRAGRHATPENSLRNVAVDFLQGDEIMQGPPQGVRGLRRNTVIWKPCTTDIYLKFECAHYDLFPNAPALYDSMI